MEKFYFKSPATCLIAGPTSSGKTNFMFNILENRDSMFKDPVKRVIYCFNTYQPKFDNYTSYVQFHKGLPSKETLPDILERDTGGEDMPHDVIIIDDLMLDMNPELVKLFTIYSHHKNITVFFLVQNLFFQHKFMRSITLNAQYIALFNLRRDISQVRVLSTQLFSGGDSKLFQDIYKSATSRQYGYLLIDIHPKNTYRIALREHIFPSEVEITYTPQA